MIRFFLSSLILVCVASGCGKGNSGDVEILRKEVGKLRQEVAALKGQLHDLQRTGRHRTAKDARGALRSPEELRARHEAMRDPEKRAELREEHKARMEERKVRMEERRKRMEERRQQRRSGGAEPQTDISSQQKQN